MVVRVQGVGGLRNRTPGSALHELALIVSDARGEGKGRERKWRGKGEKRGGMRGSIYWARWVKKRSAHSAGVVKHV
jgi:hypothetical protein